MIKERLTVHGAYLYVDLRRRARCLGSRLPTRSIIYRFHLAGRIPGDATLVLHRRWQQKWRRGHRWLTAATNSKRIQEAAEYRGEIRTASQESGSNARREDARNSVES
jgi:hypothetical protein